MFCVQETGSVPCIAQEHSPYSNGVHTTLCQMASQPLHRSSKTFSTTPVMRDVSTSSKQRCSGCLSDFTVAMLTADGYITDRTFGSSFAFPLIRHSSNSDYTRTSAHFRPPRTTIIFFSCCYRILFSFLIRRRTQHGEMKVKAAHYFFTSEQEQNQMFHICSCSLQHYHEKAKGVFQCSTAHCFRIEMETSVKHRLACARCPRDEDTMQGLTRI